MLSVCVYCLGSVYVLSMFCLGSVYVLSDIYLSLERYSETDLHRNVQQKTLIVGLQRSDKPRVLLIILQIPGR